MYSEGYEKRLKELARWGKPNLIKLCASYGVYGFTAGLHGLAGWTRQELQTEILRSEFPTEAGNG